MASYPTAVKTFTTKNSGDTIQPNDVNDLQAEVNAIEAGLLNGTANLNSSNSTVNNLSVIGNSSLGGTLAVTGAATFTAPLTVLAPVSATMSHSASQNVNSNVWTGLNWDTEVTDAQGLHSTAVNSSRITFAHSTGLYVVGASVEWNNGFSTGAIALRLLLNDTTAIGAVTQTGVLNSGGGLKPALTVSALFRASALTDYAVVMVYQDSGSTNSISSGTIYGTHFWAAKVI